MTGAVARAHLFCNRDTGGQRISEPPRDASLKSQSLSKGSENLRDLQVSQASAKSLQHAPLEIS